MLSVDRVRKLDKIKTRPKWFARASVMRFSYKGYREGVSYHLLKIRGQVCVKSCCETIRPHKGQFSVDRIHTSVGLEQMHTPKPYVKRVLDPLSPCHCGQTKRSTQYWFVDQMNLNRIGLFHFMTASATMYSTPVPADEGWRSNG